MGVRWSGVGWAGRARAGGCRWWFSGEAVQPYAPLTRHSDGVGEPPDGAEGGHAADGHGRATLQGTSAKLAGVKRSTVAGQRRAAGHAEPGRSCASKPLSQGRAAHQGKQHDD